MTHLTLTDQEFESQFSAQELAPELFDHEAHLRLAWIHVTKFGPKQAIQNVTEQIQRFAAFHGDHTKYHETVTIAAVRAVYHFVLKSESKDFSSFLKEFPQLNHKFKDLIQSHYSEDIFVSSDAKRRYISPDLQPFDKIT